MGARGPLTVAAVGDVMPAGPLGSGPVVSLLDGADVTVGNLDTALTVRGYPREKLINLRADPSVVAPELARMGFDVLSVANNHATDFGSVGLFDTLDALAGAGVRAVGGGADLETACAPAIVSSGGWRVGVSAWTAVLPTGAAAGASRPGLAPLHVRTAVADEAPARLRADLARQPRRDACRSRRRARCVRARLTPTTIGTGGVPVLASGGAFDRIAERVVRLSAELDTPVEVGEGALVVGLGAPVTA